MKHILNRLRQFEAYNSRNHEAVFGIISISLYRLVTRSALPVLDNVAKHRGWPVEHKPNLANGAKKAEQNHMCVQPLQRVSLADYVGRGVRACPLLTLGARQRGFDPMRLAQRKTPHGRGLGHGKMDVHQETQRRACAGSSELGSQKSEGYSESTALQRRLFPVSGTGPQSAPVRPSVSRSSVHARTGVRAEDASPL
jgi:hypothetical protein